MKHGGRIDSRRPSGAGARTRPAVCALVLAVALAGCGGEDSAEVKLRFWNGFTGPDGRTMLRIVQKFNEEHPGVHVLMQRMDWATYYNKLFVAGIGERAPEVFVLHDYVIARFAEADFVRPIDDLMERPEAIAEDDLLPQAWAAAEQGGRHYGLPLDIHPLGLYYNKRLFREAGLVNADGAVTPPTDLESFLEAARRTTRDLDGDGAPDEWGFVFTNFRSNVFTVMKQYGGSMFASANAPAIASPPNVEAARLCARLIQDYEVAPTPQNFDSWIGFRQGKVAMAFEGIYMIADLEKQEDLDFGGAPVPRLGPEAAAWAGSHNLCLGADLDGRELEAAWRFIRYLSDHSLEWAEGGQVPARASLRNTERFAGMEVQSAFARQLPYVVYIPKVPFVFEYYAAFDAAVERILRGSEPPAQALERADAELEEDIARREEMLRRAEGLAE